jgi:site-specific DNA-methyltransferase (adenine-specific)
MAGALRHDLTIQTRPISELTPWAKNPRDNDAAAEELAYTISEVGWTNPILLDKHGTIIAGHTRLKAAIKLGLTEVPTITLDVDGPQAELIAIADNRLSEFAEWDKDALAEILESLQAEGIDTKIAGYGDEDLSDLLASLDSEPIGPDDIEPEAPPEEPDSKRGEVYELGPHRLVCGDSLDPATVEEAVAGGIGATVADPPYGIDASKMTMGSGESAKKKSDRLSQVREWDGSAPPMAWALDLGGLLCVWGGNYFPDLPTSDDWLVWHKKNDGLSFAEAELAWTNFGKRIRVLQHHWSGEKKQHITQKPTPVIEWCLSFVPQGARVFDPFGGSGTTLIACARTGRTATLIELDPGYCDVIRKRWTAWAKEAGQDPGPGALD